ncbi:MAG: FAD-dependent oxidoreductase [Rhodospirillaceae bacterium TMED8]|nr:FAD-dependent oxidoreductase [Magnetovibrio sp.]OUT52289.1 MAG: FAD-dependent oxidoreductase [Rhodospirillaceae bacterium TMED8]|tara:strand:- start:1632 stop:2747 length:1116 start_codon:yes stop_codon:yes gene_type:complete
MVNQVECIVVGAGCVGLAAAQRLAQSGREVVLLEKSAGIGTGISSRNSEVIHAGIYYPKNSLKAQLCVRGKDLLYDFCKKNAVEYQRIGKMIVATTEGEIPSLQEIGKRARANGVQDLEWVEGARLKNLEPNVRAVAAWFSPSTGIFNSHSYMLSLQGKLEANGGMIAFFSPVKSGEVTNRGIVIETGGETPTTLSCDILINAAGLGAQDLSQSILGVPPASIPPLYFARGNYFTLTGKNPFNHLVYPVPVPGGLGTHSSIDLGGQVKFGPDVEWVTNVEYTVDPERRKKFYTDIRRYWPDLEDDALQPGYAGIRPKLSGPKSSKYGSDFVIQGPDLHGVKGMVNLYGIESPGLTSSLAIAEEIIKMLDVD